MSSTPWGRSTNIASSIQAGAFGSGIPATGQSGSTASDTEITPIPTLAVTSGRTGSPWAFGLGAFAIGDFGVDYPTDPTNPILTAQPPSGFGFGAIYSQSQLLQFCPTIARKFNSGWSVGIAPTFNWGSLAIDPFSAASPNADGRYPSILSLGLAYTGFRRVQFAADVRYIDYDHTNGFQAAGFDASGAVTGFGWSSNWVASGAVAIAMTDRLQVRFGYTFNQSPIDSASVFYNSPAPGIIQHHLSTGLTREIGNGWMWSLAYKHGFSNQVSGQWWSPAGSVPGTRVTSTLATHNLSAGLTKRF